MAGVYDYHECVFGLPLFDEIRNSLLRGPLCIVTLVGNEKCLSIEEVYVAEHLQNFDFKWTTDNQICLDQLGLARMRYHNTARNTIE